MHAEDPTQVLWQQEARSSVSKISGYGLIVKNMDSGARLPVFESQVLYLVVVRTRESY